MGAFIIVWILYITCGAFWLNWLINNDQVNDTNIIASLVIIGIWPVHLIFELIRHFKKRL